MGKDHPISWYHEAEGGRVWCTGFGHTKEGYALPLLRKHLLGGIRYAAGLAPAGAADTKAGDRRLDPQARAFLEKMKDSGAQGFRDAAGRGSSQAVPRHGRAGRTARSRRQGRGSHPARRHARPGLHAGGTGPQAGPGLLPRRRLGAGLARDDRRALPPAGQRLGMRGRLGRLSAWLPSTTFPKPARRLLRGDRVRRRARRRRSGWMPGGSPSAATVPGATWRRPSRSWHATGAARRWRSSSWSIR